MGTWKTMRDIELIIKVKPRLHITLIGMNQDGYRINGGVGFAIQEPSLELSFSRSKSFVFSDYRNSPFANGEVQRLQNVIDNAKENIKASQNINVEIKGNMPTHFGFGSSTAIRIACLEALYILNNAKFASEKLVICSGRGGTSGVGINSYFIGGFIVDLGRKSDTTIHRPSSMSENRSTLPLLMQRLEMPDWPIGICIPSKITNKDENEEKEFFLRTCPISSKKVYESLYVVIYGLYAAVRENDKKTFYSSIRKIQQCAWKLAERNEYGKNILDIEKQLYESGAAAVGMTSLGPSLFFLADDVSNVIKKMNELNADCNLLLTKPSNKGRNISSV